MRITARRRTYQAVSLERIELSGISCFHDVTYATQGMQQFFRMALVDLLSEVVDVDINDIRKCIKIIVPHMLGNHGPGQHLALVAHKILEEAIFFAGKVNLPASPVDFMTDQVEGEISDLKFGLDLGFATPQKNAYPREQL